MKSPPLGCQIPINTKRIYDETQQGSFREEHYLEGKDLLHHLIEYKSFDDLICIVLESDRAKNIVFKNIITHTKFLIAIVSFGIVTLLNLGAFVYNYIHLKK